ncbi:unnamed protein product [Leptosia nina]|uniref:Uncharacterized protein n=1 Tax=Leptosia nina TaxID=320188 RepID=A0AAV1JBX0_9NEOP
MVRLCLSRAWIGQRISKWGTVSSSSPQAQTGLSLRLNLWRYAAKPPCPVRACVASPSNPTLFMTLKAAAAVGRKIFVVEAVPPFW